MTSETQATSTRPPIWIGSNNGGETADRVASSPLATARARRRLTVEEAAARASLTPEIVIALEENRVYRFPTVEDALAATLVYATALGISRREARRLAGLPVRPRLFDLWSLRRGVAAATFLAALGLLNWFAVLPRLTEGAPPAASAPVAAAVPEAALPQPWEIQIDVYNGSGAAQAAALLANTIAGLAYRIGNVGEAKRSDYLETRVYYPPGGRAIAERLARQLNVKTTPLPGGADPLRLVVVVGG